MKVTGNAPVGLLSTGPLSAALTVWECAECMALIIDPAGHGKAAHPVATAEGEADS